MLKYMNQNGILTPTIDLPAVKILVIGAHNDDEATNIACVLKSGLSFGAIICTDGAGSNNPHYTPDQLRKLRPEESRTAMQAVRGNFLVCLQHSSSFVKGSGKAQLISELEKIIAKVKPVKILTHHPTDRHKTHDTISYATVEALRSKFDGELWGYTVWSTIDKNPLTIEVEFGPEVARLKTIMLSQYPSQTIVNDYDVAIPQKNHHDFVMRDAHTSSTQSYLERFLDMTPLIDGTFPSVTPSQYAIACETVSHQTMYDQKSREEFLEMVAERLD